MESGNAARPVLSPIDERTHGESVAPRLIGSPGLFFVALGALALAHIAMRLFTSRIAFIDESWQLVLAQKWSLGYSAQPPLYTWLQIIFFKVFGESIFTLALFKNVLLFGSYAFTYATARLLTRRHDYAVFATLYLLLVPQIAWEAQRDLTHSVLLSVTTAATLFTFFWLAEKPTITRYALFGVSVGCALLSKYNAGLFLFAFALAALCVRRYRVILLNRGALVTALACLAVAGPHYFWAWQHAGEAFSDTRKLGAARFDSWFCAAVQLPWLMIKAAAPNLTPVLVAYLLARRKPMFRLRTDAARMLFWGAVISLAILGLGMLVAKAGGLRGRWFLPLFVCAPVLLIAQLDQVPRWLSRFVAVLAAVGVIAVLVLLPWNANRGGGRRNQDLTVLTLDEVSASAGAVLNEADLIVADNFWIGGNMRLRFRKPIVTPLARWPLTTTPKRIVMVFDASRSPEPTTQLREFAEGFFGKPLVVRVVHLSSNDNPRRTGMRVGVAVIE